MKWKLSQFAIFGIITGSIVAGICAFAILNFQVFFKSKSTAVKPTTVNTPTKAILPPTAINIPRIGKNIQIKPATVKGNNWDLFDDAVAWLSTSSTPGNGNVILYAHDWNTLWADLYLLKKGDPILVQQGDTWVPYSVTESRTVDLHDVQSILTKSDRLTLYTCEGNFDQKRRVVYAQRIY